MLHAQSAAATEPTNVDTVPEAHASHAPQASGQGFVPDKVKVRTKMRSKSRARVRLKKKHEGCELGVES